ncbi:MAG: hypothetical protein HY537_07185 [Deltaproteobacteria bacterium]|nr:hypothetical protein [Deltaproteobacteria bacterium]
MLCNKGKYSKTLVFLVYFIFFASVKEGRAETPSLGLFQAVRGTIKLYNQIVDSTKKNSSSSDGGRSETKNDSPTTHKAASTQEEQSNWWKDAQDQFNNINESLNKADAKVSDTYKELMEGVTQEELRNAYADQFKPYGEEVYKNALKKWDEQSTRFSTPEQNPSAFDKAKTLLSLNETAHSFGSEIDVVQPDGSIKTISVPKAPAPSTSVSLDNYFSDAYTLVYDGKTATVSWKPVYDPNTYTKIDYGPHNGFPDPASFANRVTRR